MIVASGRMADIIRVAFRQLGGEPDALPLTPPWYLPGAEAVWQRIVETERALRGVVREVYAARFGEVAAQKIEDALPERERETLAPRSGRAPRDPSRLVSLTTSTSVSYRSSCSRRTSNRRPVPTSVGHKTRSNDS